MTDFIVPDSVTPVIAWRAWRVKDGHLVSVTAGTQWPAREPIQAVCHSCNYYYTAKAPEFIQKHEEPAPMSECSCGVYGAVDERHARGVARAHYASCIGLVAMWGKVIESTRGYRSEYAYPLELTLIGNRIMRGGLTAPAMWSDQAVDLLGHTYGVPVTVEGRA